MPTETHIIGVGTPDAAGYTTIASWMAACPANLVTADKVWRGELMAQTFAPGVISGITADATRYVELTAMAGCSFVDAIAGRTLALRANAANGAFILNSAGYNWPLKVTADYTKVSRLQLKNTASGSDSGYAGFYAAGNYIPSADFDQMLVETSGRNPTLQIAGATIRNSLSISLAATAPGNLTELSSGAKAINCTFAALGVPSSFGTYNSGTTASTLENCYFGGVSALSTGTAPTLTSCASNFASPPTGCLGNVALSTANFGNVTSGTHDFRLVAGSALIDAGTTDATNAASDISGLARPAGAAFDIGCWEYAVASSGVALAGAAQAIASAFGALSVAVPIAGAAVGVATASGALSTAMPLTGAAAAVASASGNLTLGVTLSGSAIAHAVAAGLLGTQLPLSGAAVAHAGASGNLTVTGSAALAGNAQAQAAATGTMVVQFSLAGAAVVQAAAMGNLTATGTTALAGNAQAHAAASGALSVTFPLTGAAQVVAGASGNLTSGTPLAGAAVVVTSANGNLLVTITLSGAAVAQAIASGGMSIQIPLSGAAVAHAAASGQLSGSGLLVGDAHYVAAVARRQFTRTISRRSFARTINRRAFRIAS